MVGRANEQVCACKMVTGWNAPQGVGNVHTLCAGTHESDDRGNINLSVKRLGTSLDQCIERYMYIKHKILLLIYVTFSRNINCRNKSVFDK